MSYRDDKQVLRERIADLELRISNAVSETELKAVRAELLETRKRLDEERSTVDSLLGRLGATTKSPKGRRWVRFGLVALLLSVVPIAVFAFLNANSESPYVPAQGAPHASRGLPGRMEIDRDLAGHWTELSGCVPEGQSAHIHVEADFQGQSGRLFEPPGYAQRLNHFRVRNLSERDRVPDGTADCVRQTLARVAVPPFRTPTYRYQLTMTWREGRFVRPEIWQWLDQSPPRTPRAHEPLPPPPAPPTPPPTEPGELPPTPSRQAVIAAINEIRRPVAACADGHDGRMTLELRFRNDGRVENVEVRAAFIPEPVRACVREAVQQAVVPPFQQPTFSVRFPIILRSE